MCAEGVPVTRTPEMFHVWFIDHPLGRFTEMKIVPEYRHGRRLRPRTVHPIAVHFAIALFVVAVLLDLAAVVTSNAPATTGPPGSIWCLPSVAVARRHVTGMTAEVLLTPTHEAHQTLDIHKRLAFASLGIVLLLFVWRFVCAASFRGRRPSCTSR